MLYFRTFYILRRTPSKNLVLYFLNTNPQMKEELKVDVVSSSEHTDGTSHGEGEGCDWCFNYFVVGPEMTLYFIKKRSERNKK